METVDDEFYPKLDDRRWGRNSASILMIAASLKLGFQITGSGFNAFIAAFVASLMIAFINGVLGMFLPDDKDE